jgi:hypothetical protein
LKYGKYESSNKKTNLTKTIQSQIAFEKYDRADIVFKTILRHIRKTYLKEFNACTKYVAKRRFVKLPCLIQKLDIYIQKVFKPFAENFNYDFCEVTNELTNFLGSMFYPNDMHKSKVQGISKKSIDDIHKSLYSFSISKLDYLLQWPSFKVIVHHFMTYHAEEALKKNKTMA